ncbi:hypothetical protein BDZ89DRAFT_1130727 [Hymenopellis radicata]|nr:hypothetical protein BDZ89DRAFT_1130727 [Hymenopellis radicata]
MGLLTWLRAGEWQFGFVPAERRSLVLLRQEVIKRDFCPKDITWLRLSLDPRYGNLQHSSTMFIEDVNADDHPCSRLSRGRPPNSIANLCTPRAGEHFEFMPPLRIQLRRTAPTKKRMTTHVPHPSPRTDEEGEGVFPEWESNNL